MRDYLDTKPFGKTLSRYGKVQFPLHALTVLSGCCRETSVDYYNDGSAIKSGLHVAWQYTFSGKGRLVNDQRAWDLLPGSMMIITMPSAYTYFLPTDADHWEFMFLTMVGREAIRIARTIENRWGPALAVPEESEARGLMQSMVGRLRSGEIDNPFVNSSETYRFCMRFLEEQLEKGNEPSESAFASLTAYLLEHLQRDVSVSEMADVLRLSRSYFSKIFTREMGTSPRMYLEDLRLKTAMAMLLENQISVKETAIRCGIPDVNYFCRVFKKRYGMSPGRYRSKELASGV